MRKLFVYGVVFLMCVGTTIGAPAREVRAASTTPAPALWHEVAESSVAAKRFDERVIVPQKYRVFTVDESILVATLASAPEEFTGAAKATGGLVMTLPMPDGSLQRFRVQESSVMEAPLQARFPDIRTYIAQGVDDPAATVRLDHTPLGFHAQILSPNGAVYIDPYFKNGSETYVSYFKRDYVKRDDRFECLVADEYQDADKGAVTTNATLVTGQTLRTYRLALACTAEYSAAVASPGPASVATSMSAMTTSVNRVVGVYEIDTAIRMVLVANNSSLIYTSNPDPYTNNNGGTMLGENQTNITTIIGSANYDIGHVFSTGGGGVAGLGVVCTTSQKARGVTGLGNPTGDGFDIDYVAHEMGHQFGGNHTFNGTQGSCGGGNRSSGAAYEPGSGSTIMAYAGICGSVDLQPHSDPYFHAKSVEEIVNYTNSGNGNSCPVQTSTGNTEPAVEAGAAYTIPVNTPFELTASPNVGDPNGDALTWCWEQYNLGAALNTNTDNGSSPIFRSFNPSSSPTRVFPRLSDLLGNTTSFGEVLPTTSRTMTFRCTARDNRVGAGGVNVDSTTVTSTTTAGPFAVTAPNTATSVVANTFLNVTWNVASTNAGTVNTPNVTISLSLDSGVTFPIVLRANTPNDGSESVLVPAVNTTTARIKVKGAGNIFFDVSNANFTITSPVTGGDSPGIFTAASSTFFLKNSNAGGAADVAVSFGGSPSTFVPLSGDWDGNHSNTIGLYDPATGTFFLKNANTPGAADLFFSFGPGGVGIVPLVGDWDGDGVDTIGIYNSATGVFFFKNTNASGAADSFVQFGPGGAFTPLTGDWNGDGRDTIGLYDSATGTFFLKNFNVPGSADLAFTFGGPGLTPLVGDWNLNGVDTIGIYDQATGSWFLRNTNTSGAADVVFGYGPAAVTPLSGDWDAL